MPITHMLRVEVAEWQGLFSNTSVILDFSVRVVGGGGDVDCGPSDGGSGCGEG